MGWPASKNAQSRCLALEELSSTSTPRLVRSFLNLSSLLVTKRATQPHVDAFSSVLSKSESPQSLAMCCRKMLELLEVRILKAAFLCLGMSRFR